MKVLICADSVQKTMGLYLGQLEKAGIPVVWGPPSEKIGHGVGWKSKVDWYRDTLKGLDPDERVILTDGWDVVFQGTLADVEERFPEHGYVLVSGEKNCWPDHDAQRHYPQGHTPWQFVNSGCIAGRVEDVLREMDRAYSAGAPELLADDQRLWTWLFLSSKRKRVRIDYDCSLFQTTLLNLYGWDLVIENATGKLTNLRTGMTPCFIHANTGVKWSEKELQMMGMVA